MEAHKKYRFEFRNKTGEELKVSFFAEDGMNLFRLKPLAVIAPGAVENSGIFYLTEGKFKIRDLDHRKEFGLLNVHTCR